MNYTYQETSESGSFSQPWGNDVSHASSIKELRHALERWQDSHNRVGSDERDASLVVWKGTLEDVTDVYPEFILKPGPRGGMIRESY
jgi:hypothetical protein